MNWKTRVWKAGFQFQGYNPLVKLSSPNPLKLLGADNNYFKQVLHVPAQELNTQVIPFSNRNPPIFKFKLFTNSSTILNTFDVSKICLCASSYSSSPNERNCNHPISWDTINMQTVSSLFPAFSVKLRKKKALSLIYSRKSNIIDGILKHLLFGPMEKCQK